MLRNSPTTYWKSTSAIRKNKYNTTQVVDGVCGDSNIANLFRKKYQSLCNSVKSLEEEMIELSGSIKSAIAKECDCAETVKGSSRCHDIDNSDVSKAVAKLKTDKISDNGLVYSNNFIYGTNCYLSVWEYFSHQWFTINSLHRLLFVIKLSLSQKAINQL